MDEEWQSGFGRSWWRLHGVRAHECHATADAMEGRGGREGQEGPEGGAAVPETQKPTIHTLECLGFDGKGGQCARIEESVEEQAGLWVSVDEDSLLASHPSHLAYMDLIPFVHDCHRYTMVLIYSGLLSSVFQGYHPSWNGPHLSGFSHLILPDCRPVGSFSSIPHFVR